MVIIRLKEIRRREQRIRSIKELIGASAVDPKTAKVKALFEMFHLSA
jgi:hypothetical protein